jgi:hypothetical protein
MRANCINSSGLNYTAVQQLFTCAGANTNLQNNLPLCQNRGGGVVTEEPGKTLGEGCPSRNNPRPGKVGSGRVLWE